MMKWATIIFLLLNVGYFGWQMNQRLDHVVPAMAITEDIIPASTETLVLLNELEELPPLREETVVTTETIEIEEVEESSIGMNEVLSFSIEGTCISIGPYGSEEEFMALKEWLQTRNQPVRERVEEIRTRERYWVYLEPKDEAEAKEKLRELQSKGLNDYYMISKGDMKNAISLGLFSSQETVNRRLVELEKEGYNPVVVPQYKSTRALWLDVQIENEQILPELPEGIEITNLDCLEIALPASDH